MRRAVGGVLVIPVLFIASCAGPGHAANDGDATLPSVADVSASSNRGEEPAEYELCAEFPHGTSSPADRLEGWWNSTPVDPATGEVVTDPAMWQDVRMREHPRVAIVNSDSGEFVTWDRTLCGQDPSYEPVIEQKWPTHSLVVVDMDTGEVLSSTTLDSIAVLDAANTGAMEGSTDGGFSIDIEPLVGADAAHYAALAHASGLEVVRLEQVTIEETGEIWIDGALIDPNTGSIVAFTWDETQAGIPDDGSLELYSPVDVPGARVLGREDVAVAHFLAESAEGTSLLSIDVTPAGPEATWPAEIRDEIVHTLIPAFLDS